MADEKSRVFVPQVPSRFDAATRLWVPTVNLSPAKLFGEIIVLLPSEANRLHTAPLIAAMQEKMKDFKPYDFVVAVGDPSLIMAAGCIAARKTGGKFRVLKWDRMASGYLPVELNV